MSSMQRRDFVRHLGAAGAWVAAFGAAPLASAAPIKPDAKAR